jgi:cell division protein FtsI/penicillin-binding protein 2
VSNSINSTPPSRGVLSRSEPKRFYPAGKAVAHLVGYVSEVNEADLTADRYPGAVLGSLVGKAGLEREYDDTLRGSEGVRYIEVNARGRLVREGAASALPPTPGKPIVTTVDLDLQRFVDSIWPAGMRGALVAMTPQGEVRALYSAPNFDPNSFVGGISSAEWRKLNNDPAKPLLNERLSKITELDLSTPRIGNPTTSTVGAKQSVVTTGATIGSRASPPATSPSRRLRKTLRSRREAIADIPPPCARSARAVYASR